MRLKNTLIVVSDIEQSKAFYKELFGLTVIRDFDGNVILTEGLVLQDKAVWEQYIGKEVINGGNGSELYFEEANLDCFIERLENSTFEINYVNQLMTHDWGQRVVRFYDPDMHLIEVGEPFRM